MNFTYVDNSNVFAEGQRASAVAQKFHGASTYVEAMNNNVVDRDWQLDYGHFASICLWGKGRYWGRKTLGVTSPK